jgi:hypothetical protein
MEYKIAPSSFIRNEKQQIDCKNSIAFISENSGIISISDESFEYEYLVVFSGSKSSFKRFINDKEYFDGKDFDLLKVLTDKKTFIDTVSEEDNQFRFYYYFDRSVKNVKIGSLINKDKEYIKSYEKYRYNFVFDVDICAHMLYSVEYGEAVEICNVYILMGKK